jgi:hypothetical protein
MFRHCIEIELPSSCPSRPYEPTRANR